MQAKHTEMGGVKLKVIVILRKYLISNPKTNTITFRFTPPIADGLAVVVVVVVV